MALVLRLEERKMPKGILRKFQESESGDALLFIPSMVLAEIGYLSEKKRIDTNLIEVENYIEKFDNVDEHFLSLKVVKASFGIDDIPELHDRLIAATAKIIGCPIMTNDPEIKASKFIHQTWD